MITTLLGIIISFYAFDWGPDCVADFNLISKRLRFLKQIPFKMSSWLHDDSFSRISDF